MLLILLPASLSCLVMSRPLVEVIFQRGQFDTTATHLTANALSGYGAGLVFIGMGYVFPRILLALGKSYMIALLGATNVLLKIAYNWLLIPYLGHAGIAFGTSLMYATTDVLFVVLLLRAGVRFDLKSLLLSFGVGLGLSAVMLSAALGVQLLGIDASVAALGAVTGGVVAAYFLYRWRRLRSLVFVGYD